MPNYCENDLFVYGTPAEVQKFLGFIASPDAEDEDQRILDFGKVIPYPEQFAQADAFCRKVGDEAREISPDDPQQNAKLEALFLKHGVTDWPKDGYNQGGYDWFCENWGTKWNAGSVVLEKRDPRDEDATLHFETPWSPPTPVIQALAAQFPELEITHEYYECGMAFCGSAFYQNGQVKNETVGPYYGARGG